MARKNSKTKEEQERIKRQYNYQRNRIKKNYEDIQSQGGRFSQTLDEIIRPPKKIQESTIRRLRAISKDDLYRLAKTETGESGWKLRTEKLKRSSEKARRTREIKRDIIEFGFGEYDADLHGRYKEYKKYTDTPSKYKYSFDEWKEIEYGKLYSEFLLSTSDAGDWLEDEEQDSLWHQEYKPEIIPPEPEPDIPEVDYPQGDYEDDYSSEQGSMQDYRDNLKDNIENVLNNNQDSTFLNGLKNMFNDMVNNMTDDELSDWLYEKGQAFYEAIQDVEKYNPTITHTGNGLKRFNEAVDMMNNGITPLDKFENPMIDSGSGSYLPKSNEQSDQYSSRKYTDGEWTALVDTTTGEMFWGREETVLVKVNKWGNPIYETKWFDEHGLTIDYGGHIFPLSEVEDNEDYFR